MLPFGLLAGVSAFQTFKIMTQVVESLQRDRNEFSHWIDFSCIVLCKTKEPLEHIHPNRIWFSRLPCYFLLFTFGLSVCVVVCKCTYFKPQIVWWMKNSNEPLRIHATVRLVQKEQWNRKRWIVEFHMALQNMVEVLQSIHLLRRRRCFFFAIVSHRWTYLRPMITMIYLFESKIHINFWNRANKLR